MNQPNSTKLHETYCFHAHQTLPFPHFRFRWEAWATMEGHTESNLVMVLEYLNHRRAL